MKNKHRESFFEPLPENELPEFKRILASHYEAASERGLEEQNLEVQSITGNRDVPTFFNTIEVM